MPPGVDEAAYVKAGFLSAIAKGETECSLIDRAHAVKLLGNMHGGYNIETLVGLLTDDELSEQAAAELKHTLLMFEAFHDVAELAEAGNANAKAVMQSWADGEWFTIATRCPSPSRLLCSRSPAKPIPMTCPPLPTPGRARTSPCTHWRCTR